MTLRALLWSVHRWIGLALVAPFLVLAITGLALLVCRGAGLGATASLPHPITDLAAFDRALASAKAEAPGSKAGLVLPGADPRHAWSLQLRSADGRTLVAEFDPSHGRVVRIRPSGSSLQEILLSIHNSLALGQAGRLVILATAIGLVMLAVSGFTIMRRRWRILAQSPLRGPLRIRTLHHWTGLVALTFVLLWASSGFLLLTMKGGGGGGRDSRPAPPLACAPAPIAPMLKQALAARPGGEIQGVMPGAGGRPTTVMVLDRRAPPWAKSSSLTFDGCTGVPRPGRPAPPIMAIMIAAKALHTGLWGSTATVVLYGLAAMTTLVLTLTGPWLWLRRRLFLSTKASS